MSKPVESVIVSEVNVNAWEAIEAETWTDEDTVEYEKLGKSFIDCSPSNFYVLLATGDRCYYKTRDRKLAQEQANIDWDFKYTVRAVKDQKSRSRQENGEVSVRGSNTRKCFSPRLKGLK